MFKYYAASIILLFSVQLSVSQDGPPVELGDPSIGSLLEKSRNQQLPNEKQIADYEILKTLIGFPYDRNGVDKIVEMRLGSIKNLENGIVSREILAMYWSGSLVKEKRDDYLSSLLKEEMTKKNRFPIEGMNGLMAVSSKDPERINPARVLAAILISGCIGSIQQIEPYLEFSTVYIGDDSLATGSLPMFSKLWDNTIDAYQTIIPDQRLKFWPSAFAILKNQEQSVPKLISALQDKNLREDLRLRAASFLNTIDPNILDQELLESLEPNIATQVQCIKDKLIKWRHSIRNVCKEKTERQKQRERKIREKLNIPDNVSLDELKRQDEKLIWGNY